MTTPDQNNPPPKFKANSDGLDGDAILQAVNQVIQMRMIEQYRLDHIAKYMRGRHDPPYTPRGASTEYRWLTRRARDNFLPLIVSVISQNLHVDGFRPSSWSPDDEDTDLDITSDAAWSGWRANRMTSRQHGINRSVTKYGCAYASVLPGRIATVDKSSQMIVDKSMPVVTPYSPRKMTAMYADDISDEWPIIAVAEFLIADRSAPGKYRRLVKVLDDTNVYTLVGGYKQGPTKITWPQQDDPILSGNPAVQAHGMGICPVVRFTYEADLDADTDCIGEVEPLISLQDQVNFHTFNELLAEQFAAFKQRWVTGMIPVDEKGRQATPFKPGSDRLWVSENNDTKFGEFSETNLGAISATREDTIRHMATISQLPPYHLLGSLINLSADALAAANNGMDRKIEQLKEILGDPYRNVFRLISKASGDDDGWQDLYGSVLWRDTSSRSFASTMDGLGKATQMLGIPAEELWQRMPGATLEDVAIWKQAAQQKTALAQINKVVEAVMTGGLQTANPTPDAPNQVGLAAATGLQSKPLEAAAPAPGAPGDAAPDADANGQPPGGGGSHPVEIPAHTRSMPDVPKPKKPSKPAGA